MVLLDGIVPSINSLLDGTVPSTNFLLDGTVASTNSLLDGNLKKLVSKRFPRPLKAPLVRPQKCQSFVQRLRGTLFPEGNRLSVISPIKVKRVRLQKNLDFRIFSLYCTACQYPAKKAST